MVADKGFSHITLSADEEDDFVIQAGVVGGVSREGAAAVGSAAREDAAVPVAEDAGGAAAVPADVPYEDDDVFGTAESALFAQEDEAAEAVDGAPIAAATASAGLVELAADEEAREEYLRHMRRQQARRAASEMVTTEEDLHAKTPFSAMRIAIVVAGVLLVALALVYWFVLR